MDKPSKLPRWGDTTPSNITEPTELEKGVGFPAGSARRQFMNWLLNTGYQWFGWLDQIVFRSSDFGPDQAIPGVGTAPAIGAGRNILANAFSARGYIDGYAIATTTGPTANYTYSTTSDTYWDLGRDGVWYPSVVVAAASAPALAANRIRVYMVRTDATNRTALTDYRASFLSLTKNLDLTRIRHGDSNLGTDVAAAIPRQETRYRPGHTAKYTHVHSFIDNTAAGNIQAGSHLYIREFTDEVVVVRGCTWNGTQWVSDPGSPGTFSMESLNGESKTCVTLISSIVGTPFADSVWNTAQASGNGVFRGFVSGGSVQASLGTTNYEKAEVGGFKIDPPTGSGNIKALLLKADSYRAYAFGAANNGLGGSSGRGGAHASNAYLVASTGKWARIYSGIDSYLVAQDSSGFKVLFRDSGDATPWDDTIDDSMGWKVLATIDQNGTFTRTLFSDNIEAQKYVAAGLGLTSAFEHSEVGAFQTVPKTASSDPRCLSADYGSLRIYSHGAVNNGIGGDGRGGANVSNASYVSATDKWVRTAAGDAFAIVSDSGGIKFLRRSAVLASPWDDTIDPTNGWTMLLHVTSTFQPDTVVPVQATASPTIPHTLYRGNIIKVFGSYVLDTSGGFSSSSFLGCSAVVVGSDVIVTFDNLMASDRYHAEVSAGTSGYSGHATSRAAGGFILKASLTDPFTPINQSTSALEISFSVVGHQA